MNHSQHYLSLDGLPIQQNDYTHGSDPSEEYLDLIVPEYDISVSSDFLVAYVVFT